MANYFKFDTVSYVKAVTKVCAEYGVDPFHHSITLVDVFDGEWEFIVKNKHGVIHAFVTI